MFRKESGPKISATTGIKTGSMGKQFFMENCEFQRFVERKSTMWSTGVKFCSYTSNENESENCEESCGKKNKIDESEKVNGKMEQITLKSEKNNVKSENCVETPEVSSGRTNYEVTLETFLEKLPKPSSISDDVLKEMKAVFSKEINSRRTESEILEVKQLVEVLVDRGCLTQSDLSPLSTITDILKCNGIFLSEDAYLETNSTSTGGKKIIELDHAIRYLCPKLNDSWSTLCLALELDSNDIRTCKSLCECNPPEQALQALMIWKEKTSNASVKNLIGALRSKICRQEDLASDLERKFCQ